MIDCERASTLTLAEQDRRLGLRERIALALHRLVCAPCRFYRRQMDALRRAAAGLEEPPASGLDDAARRRIRERLAAGQQDLAE